MIDNLMALEPELMARIKSQLASTAPHVHVLCAADLAGVTEESQPTPAVQVIYHGYRMFENRSRSDGRAAGLVQTWLAVVVTRNLRGLKTGSDARASAGALGHSVATALMGYRAPSASGPCVLVNAPQASYSSGVQYLPLAIEALLLLEAA